MKIQEIRELLQKDNPKTPTGQIELYSRQFATYLEAAENIQANGVIVSHPRTGQPMENPYLKVRAAAEASFGKMRMIKSDSLWAIAAKLLDDIENNSEK